MRVEEEGVEYVKVKNVGMEGKGEGLRMKREVWGGNYDWWYGRKGG